MQIASGLEQDRSPSADRFGRSHWGWSLLSEGKYGGWNFAVARWRCWRNMLCWWWAALSWLLRTTHSMVSSQFLISTRWMCCWLDGSSTGTPIQLADSGHRLVGCYYFWIGVGSAFTPYLVFFFQFQSTFWIIQTWLMVEALVLVSDFHKLPLNHHGNSWQWYFSARPWRRL